MYLNRELYISRSERLRFLDKFPEVGKILKAARQKPRSFCHLCLLCFPMPS